MAELINGSGYDSADIMFVADYARKFDSTSGKCLSGYYQQKLNDYLKPANYTVDQTYRTCIIKTYIKGLGVGSWSSDKKLLESCFETAELEPLGTYMTMLLEEINAVKPTIIVALGEFALRILTDKEGISKWRGSVLKPSQDILSRLDYLAAPNLKILASYHPYVVQNQEELQFLLRLDFKKAVEMVFEPRPIDYHEIHIARTSVDMLRFIEQYPLEQFKEMTYDIETHMGIITCAGFSFDGFRGMTIPLYGATEYDLTDRTRMLHILSHLLSERDVGNQNVGYDKRISARFNLHIPNIAWDTSLAHTTMACEFPKNLGFLTSLHTDMSFYKDEGRNFDPRKQSIDQYYAYNCKDAIATFQIWQKQKKELADLDLLDFFNDFVMRLFNFYYNLDSVGILIDPVKQRQLRAKYEGLYTLKELELFTITNTKLNLNSPSQIGKFMESYEFPVLRHRVDSGYMVVNTDVDSIKKMLVADPLEYRKCLLPHEQALRFLRLILLLRRVNRILEYVDVLVHPWGRVHTASNLGGTTSGRTSGGKTMDQWPVYIKDKKGEIKVKWENMGQSFQTVTKHGFIIEGEDEAIEDGIIGNDLREMYIPDKNWLLVEVDGSQAEARVCDVLGEDWDSLAEYGRIDKHCAVAAMIYKTVQHNGRNYTYDEIFQLAKKLKHPDGLAMRQIGKHSKHAKNNGMEHFLFATKYLHLANFKESLKTAKLILHALDKAYPNIENVFHKQVEECVRSTRMLISPRAYGVPCGRKRLFFKKIDKHYLNVAYSHLPQSAISDHTKAAALRIMDRVEPGKAHPVAENHDSLTSLVHYTYLRKYCIIAKEEMEKPIDFRGCSLHRDFELVIPAEFSIGRRNWGNMKEVKKFKM